jgi:hypothetical protein
MPRLFQFSLRTILEAVFVAAVVSAFLYWRNVPHNAPGRYQMLVRGSQEIIFVDTSTGKAWVRHHSGLDWERISTPIAP